MFDDPVLAPLVLEERLAVSTAAELLREPDTDARRELAIKPSTSDGSDLRSVPPLLSVTLRYTSPRRGWQSDPCTGC